MPYSLFLVHPSFSSHNLIVNSPSVLHVRFVWNEPFSCIKMLFKSKVLINNILLFLLPPPSVKLWLWNPYTSTSWSRFMATRPAGSYFAHVCTPSCNDLLIIIRNTTVITSLGASLASLKYCSLTFLQPISALGTVVTRPDHVYPNHSFYFIPSIKWNWYDKNAESRRKRRIQPLVRPSNFLNEYVLFHLSPAQ